MSKAIKRTLIAAAVSAGLGMSLPASAIMSLHTGGGQTWHFTNWEVRVVQTGVDGEGNPTYNTLEGLIRVDEIFDAGGNTLFSTNPHEEIVGYFTGINVINPYAEALGMPFNFSGGVIKLWYDTSPDFNPSKDPTLGSGPVHFASDSPGATNYAPDVAPLAQAPLAFGNAGAGVTDGDLFADIVLDPGISLTMPAATLAGSIRALVATDDGLGSPAFQGDGSAFGSIIGGSAKPVYDTNGFNALFGPSDFRLDNTFFITNGPGPIEINGIDGTQCPPSGIVPGFDICFNHTTNQWDTHSDDPVKLLAIPEPGSLALAGLALLGLGFARRRSF